MFAKKSLQKSNEKEEDLIIHQRYRVVHKIGSGTFGLVLFATDLWTTQNIALKLEGKMVGSARLCQEYRVYKSLKGQIGFPEAFWYGELGEFHVLAMQLLGPSLEDLFNFCDRRFSLKTVLLLADQLISRIETLHRMGFIHRDIKAENFAMGLGSNDNTVFKYRTGSSHLEHIPFARNRSFCGTLRFASLNAHYGFELSRRDDLISLCYTLIYFLVGELPWFKFKSKATSKQECSELTASLKKHSSTHKLCEGCPEEFVIFLNYCYELEFDEMPDYAQIKRLLWSLFVEKGFLFNGVFDWHLYRYAEDLRKQATKT